LSGRRIGIVTDGLVERRVGDDIRIANGGVGVYIYQLIQHLLEDDRENEYILIRFGQGSLDVYRHTRAHCVWLPLRKWKPLEIVFDLPYARLAREFRLDLLHFPNQFGGAFLPSSIRRVATLHDLTPVLFPRTHPVQRVMAFRLLARLSLRKCDQIIVPSEATRADVIRGGYASAENISTIPMGASEIFKPGVRSPDFMKRHGLERAFILNVGVLEPRKNQVLLFEALRKVRESGGDVDLVIIGREGWRWVDPLELPEYAALRPYVHIFRDIPDAALAEFYGRAAVFAYPSLYEGFGLPIIEAIACETPVVASDNSSLPELGGKAALYADAHDSAGFAAQILRLLEDTALRNQLVTAGKSRVSGFRWKRTARLTSELFERVCDRSSGARVRT
jgi:glycosyltransferase involved in cell wall biosynthesis